MRRIVMAFLIGSALVIVATPATAAPRQVGLLDPRFGGDGKVTTGLLQHGRRTEDSGNAVVVQPDGRIVVAGTQNCPKGEFDTPCAFVVIRYMPHGALDRSFGGSGKIVTRFFNGAMALDVTLQPDGKILVAGGTYTELDENATAMARYEPDGSLDPTFGHGGKVRMRGVFADGEAILPDGKILVAGPGGLERYDTDGSPDLTFGDGGVVATALRARDLSAQPDGSIVVVGSRGRMLAVARYLPDGIADATFGTGGTAAIALGPGYANANAVAIQGDGGVVVTGSYHYRSLDELVVARLTPNGAIDTSFGNDGWTATVGEYAGGWDARAVSRSVAIQPDGAVVVAGTEWIVYYGNGQIENADWSSFLIARFTSHGSSDRTFSGDGLLLVTFGPGNGFQSAAAMTLQSDGAIVTAGEAPSPFRDVGDVGVARVVVPAYRPDALVRSGPETFEYDDVYATTGTFAVGAGPTTRFTVGAQNDGDTTDSFVVRGCASSDRFIVRYSAGGRSVTNTVTHGSYVLESVPPGATRLVRLEILARPATPRTAMRRCTVLIRSVHDHTRADTVIADVVAGRSGCRVLPGKLSPGVTGCSG